MTTSKIHATDGGILRGALCEEPTGDTAFRERDVTCVDCLDLLEARAKERAEMVAPATAPRNIADLPIAAWAWSADGNDTERY